MVTGKPHKPSKFVRFVLYPLVGVLFALVLGVILTMANGYRFTHENGKFGLTRTGMIIVSSRPFDGQVILNGKTTKYRSGFYLLPTKISGVKPGFYDIEVTKSGFLPWKNRLEVSPNMVAWANYILLFAEKLNIAKIDAPVGSVASSSENGRHILLTALVDNKFHLESLDSNNLSIKEFWPTSQVFTEPWLVSPQIVSAEYSLNNDRVLLELKNADALEFVVLDASGNQPKLTRISTILAKSFTGAWWSPVNNNALYLESSGEIYLANISDTKLASPLLTKVVSFDVAEGRQAFYVVKDVAGTYSVGRMNLDGSNEATVVPSILPGASFKLGYSTQTSILVVLNEENHLLTAYYLGGSGKKHSLDLSSDVVSFGWYKNGQKLYYYGKDFVKRYDWEKGRETLATLDTAPLSVDWFFDENHYLIRTEKGVFVMDYDGYNHVPISEVPATSMVLDHGNNNVIFSTKDPNNLEKYYKYISEF